MTQRLYYDDAYIADFSARIIEQFDSDGRIAVILDQTYFYPTGGGQPHDTGTIEGIQVLDVVSRENGNILHILEKSITGETVQCHVDWSRRFDHMQHHTGQHILTQAFIQTANAQTVGFHLSPDTVTIDLDQTGLITQKLDAAETLANQIIQQNRPVTARLITLEEAEGIRIRKMPEKIYTDGLRVIDIDGFDITACGGTHVNSTGAVALLKIVKVEKRGDKTRIEFRCGNRALQDYADKHNIISALTADLTCGANEIQQSIGRLHDELKLAQQTLKATTNRLLDYEAEELYTNTTEQLNGTKLITRTFENRDIEEVRLLASKLAEAPSTIALLGTSGEKAQLIFVRSKNLSYDMNNLLKNALNTFGAKGGGRSEMAQGGGIPASKEQILMAIDQAQQTLKGL